MTLKQYAEAINNMAKTYPKLEVFMSSDAEGNDIHSVGEVVQFGTSNVTNLDTDKRVPGIILFPRHDTWE